VCVWITLRATGLLSKVRLFELTVDREGRWTYESLAVEHASGQLSPANFAQLKSFYDKVNWELEVLNSPLRTDDRILFELDVVHDGDDRRLYQFSEQTTHRSWEFQDLFHFLRHNVATAGDPVGFSPDPPQEQPPAMQ